MKIILASNSPRRRELLKMCNIDFEAKVVEIDEKSIEKEIIDNNRNKNPYELAELITKSLSKNKALAVSNIVKNKVVMDNDKFDNCVVIGSDTVVVCDKKILGKPVDYDDAYNTLVYLCGKKHRVYTAVSFVCNEKIDTICEFTEVVFHDYDAEIEKVIRDYLDSKSPFDKAGSYGIQDFGSLLVKEIIGDYYTVVGFPISKVYKKLLKYK